MPTRDEMRREAIERLKMLDLHENVLKDFEDDNKLNYSERVKLATGQREPYGILYWLDNEPEWARLVKEFEDEHGALVYHATHEYTTFGECLDLLIVSKYEDEWERDRDELMQGYAFAWVINLDYPEFSEFGTIGIKCSGGGIIRTA